MNLILTILFLAGTSVGFVACRPTSADRAGESPAGTVTKKPLYHCPMHPTYTSDRPGDCPICHMSLVPIERGEPSADDHAEHTPGDRAAVYVAGEKEQWIGVRTATVKEQEMEILVRASARVSYDPDLYAALAEHREVLATQNQGGAGSPPSGGSAVPEVSGGGREGAERAEALLRSSRLRLAQFGLTNEQMDRMAQSGGAGLLAGTGPGLVYVQVYEEEAGMIKPGLSVDLTSSGLPGKRLVGRVESLDRVVDPVTRTLRARVRVVEGAHLLRPEMYLEARIHVSLGRRRVLPKEAVIDTGLRRIVYVKTEPGHYVPREVVLGREAEDVFEVLAGLDEGEEVVVSAQFLIDSESRLKAVINK